MDWKLEAVLCAVFSDSPAGCFSFTPLLCGYNADLVQILDAGVVASYKLFSLPIDLRRDHPLDIPLVSWAVVPGTQPWVLARLWVCL